MPINYTNLFGDLGKTVKATDQLHDLASSAGAASPDFDALRAEIQTQFESTGRQDVLEGLENTFNGFRNTSSGWARTLSAKAQARLLHRETVINQLTGVSPGDLDRVLQELFIDMVANSETLNESVVSAAAPTFVGSGNGELLTTTKLDGYNPPSPGFASFVDYRNVDSALAVPSETMSLTTVRDEDSNGTPEGHEVFLLEGLPAPGGAFDWKSEGSGVTQEVTTIQAYDNLANRSFEAWVSGGGPVNWTIEAGVAGTDIVQETTLADIHRGVAALKLDGNGTNIRLIQTVPSTILNPNRHMILGCFIKTAGVTTGTLTIQFESPSGGYTAAASEKIELNAAALQALATYTRQSFFWMLPASLPDDLRLVIRYEGTPTGEVWIDSMGFAPIVYGNGVGFAIIAGSTQFLNGDRFKVAITNTEGVFQRFFRRRFLFQLPQSGSPTILDSLAT